MFHHSFNRPRNSLTIDMYWTKSSAQFGFFRRNCFPNVPYYLGFLCKPVITVFTTWNFFKNVVLENTKFASRSVANMNYQEAETHRIFTPSTPRAFSDFIQCSEKVDSETHTGNPYTCSASLVFVGPTVIFFLSLVMSTSLPSIKKDPNSLSR